MNLFDVTNRGMHTPKDRERERGGEGERQSGRQ